MINLASLAFAFALGANAFAESFETLEPTRVRWCESLFSLADRAPAPAASLAAALTEAEARAAAVVAKLDAREVPNAAEVNWSLPNDRNVEANLRHRTTFELERHQRSSRGRLAKLRADVAAGRGVVFARVDVGSAAILDYLDALDARARWRSPGSRADAEVPLNPSYVVRSVLSVGGLGCLTLGCTAGSLHNYGVSDNVWALFTSAGVLSAVEFGKSIYAYGGQLKSPAARVRLENAYNDARVDAEPDALRRLRSMAAAPHLTTDFFAHHGYVTRVSEATGDDLVARRRPATPSPGGLFKFKRDPVKISIDHVLFRDAHDRPTLLTTGRVSR